ncbi:MAG: GNAT family N-acetyltransferase [Nitrospinae bacterium]|nr:GNAT family N-acetyltransferase [Nitrospinota bacterium]
MPHLAIEKLSGKHDVEGFDCGKIELNCFLRVRALNNQQAGSVQTYVACREKKVVGYYSLTVGSVAHKDAPERVVKGLAKYPVPLMILARLAVDREEQEQGIGKGLLKDALLRTVQASDIAGIRAILVHAKNDNAKVWYRKFDFDPSPTDPLHLYLLIKDIKKIIR